MTQTVQDLVYAARSLRGNPALVVTVTLTLGLGIGGTTGTFAVIDQLFLKPLPFSAPEQVVQLTTTALPPFGGSMGQGAELSYPMYVSLRDAAGPSAICAAARVPVHVGLGDQAERVNAELVSGNYFATLGIGAAAGRTITEADDKPGTAPVVVVSYSYWKRRLDGATRIGQRVLINGNPVTIVGVAQEGFNGFSLDEPVQVFLPVLMQPSPVPTAIDRDSDLFRWVRVYARVRPPATVSSMLASLEPSFHSLIMSMVGRLPLATAPLTVRQRFVDSRLQAAPASHPYSEVGVQQQTLLWVLWGLTASVLVIACMNVASLLTVRAPARRAELAIRLALGASPAQLVRQLFMEASLLVLCGGALGVAVSGWGARLLALYLHGSDDVTGSLWPGARALSFGVTVTAVSCFVVGVRPALQASRWPTISVLRADTAATLHQPRSNVRRLMIVSQAALSLAALVGAALFVQSLQNLLRVDLGFAASKLLMFRLDTSLNGYEPARAMRLSRDVQLRLQQLPGVVSAAYADIPVLGGNAWFSPMKAERGDVEPGRDNTVRLNVVSPGYFSTLGLRETAGRNFTEADTDPGGTSFFRAAIVNERFVKTMLAAGSDPIDQRIAFAVPGPPRWIPIVGVVTDSKYASVREGQLPQVFVPVTGGVTGFTFYVRTRGNPSAVLGSVRQAIAGLDPSLPASELRSVEDQRGRSLRAERALAFLGSLFAALAAGLTAIGVQGVVAYTVARKTREIGVRMALGATSRAIAGHVLAETCALVAVGIGIGCLLVIAAAGFVQTQLYGVAAGSVPILAVGGLATLGIALLGALRPTWIAVSLNPVEAMRFK